MRGVWGETKLVCATRRRTISTSMELNHKLLQTAMSAFHRRHPKTPLCSCCILNAYRAPRSRLPSHHHLPWTIKLTVAPRASWNHPAWYTPCLYCHELCRRCTATIHIYPQPDLDAVTHMTAAASRITPSRASIAIILICIRKVDGHRTPSAQPSTTIVHCPRLTVVRTGHWSSPKSSVPLGRYHWEPSPPSSQLVMVEPTINKNLRRHRLNLSWLNQPTIDRWRARSLHCCYRRWQSRHCPTPPPARSLPPSRLPACAAAATTAWPAASMCRQWGMHTQMWQEIWD